MKLTKPIFTRCLCKHGGIFLGIRIQLPVTTCDEYDAAVNQLKWSSISISIGLIAWQISFMINYNYRHMYP